MEDVQEQYDEETSSSNYGRRRLSSNVRWTSFPLNAQDDEDDVDDVEANVVAPPEPKRAKTNEGIGAQLLAKMGYKEVVLQYVFTSFSGQRSGRTRTRYRRTCGTLYTEARCGLPNIPFLSEVELVSDMNQAKHLPEISMLSGILPRKRKLSRCAQHCLQITSRISGTCYLDACSNWRRSREISQLS